MTELVGRRAEVAEVCRALADARMVTIIGPGGVGKTRVALRAVRQSANHFPDGESFVELSGLLNPRLLPDTVAARLGLARQESRQPLDTVLDHLRPRRFLLALDTCEHLVEECAMFAETVLREAPDVTILATSRQPLDAVGEHTYQLSPLPVPDAIEDPGGAFVPGPRPVTLTGAGNAAELFARRAVAADPAFTVTSDNWADAVRVCRRLDGIPLAIELAAVRLRALPLRELADRLDRRFDTLAARRTGTPRHQTLRTAIEWSYDLCTEAERTLWARLSVFAGGFDIAAAEEICSSPDLPPDQILPTLVGLVEKSVVTMDDDRYRMLDTIREFGAGRLAASGQERTCRERFTDRYLEAARVFDRHFMDHDQLARLRAMRAEHANLRAAIQYGLTSDDERMVRVGAELATALHGYWTIAGLPREGTYWLGMALDRLPDGPSAERAWALITLGYLDNYAGEPVRAVAETRDGIQMALDLGDDGLLLARAYTYQNMALMFNGQLEEAFAAEIVARPLLEALNDRIGLLFLDAQMGHLYELALDLDSALAATDRCLDRLREGSVTGEIGERWMQSYCLMVVGLAQLFLGRDDEATSNFGRSLPMSHERGDTVGCGYALEGLGWISESKQRWTRAAWLLGAADARWKEAGARLGGNPILEEIHGQRADSARRNLGEARFTELFDTGATCPLEDVIAKAVGDADDLGWSGEPGGGRPAGDPSAELTRREREIAGLVASGMSNREIAEQLVISRRTVDSHVEHIFAKLGVSSRLQLAVKLTDEET
ncbi:MAG: LuxR family transcriptional regulator [Nocardiopsaceae bacterium]|nr:LuxR family transcriptional regulator [Nocardiopsaceae bacterium]